MLSNPIKEITTTKKTIAKYTPNGAANAPFERGAFELELDIRHWINDHNLGSLLEARELIKKESITNK